VPESKRHPARRPQQRPARRDHRSPVARPAPTPTASPARQSLERWSAVPLVMLHRLPTWVTPVALVVLLLAGLALPFAAAGILLLLLAAFLGWLLALSWPITSTSGRLLRLIAVAALVGAAVARLTGHF
jgi:hypothetical protein